MKIALRVNICGLMRACGDDSLCQVDNRRRFMAKCPREELIRCVFLYFTTETGLCQQNSSNKIKINQNKSRKGKRKDEFRAWGQWRGVKQSSGFLPLNQINQKPPRTVIMTARGGLLWVLNAVFCLRYTPLRSGPRGSDEGRSAPVTGPRPRHKREQNRPADAAFPPERGFAPWP